MYINRQFVDSFDNDCAFLKDYSVESVFIDRILSSECVKNRASVLDVACGTGSHIVNLAQMGHDCAALDINPDMLRITLEKASSCNVNVDTYLEDMSNFCLPRRFTAAINMFYSFQDCLHTDKMQIDCLVSINNNLEPGGILVMEFLPEENNLENYPPGREFEIFRKHQDDGTTMVLTSCNKIIDDSIKRITFCYQWMRDGDLYKREEKSFHIKRLFLKDIDRLFRDCGFDIINRYGGYSVDCRFSKASNKMISVFRKV
ncbi:MAG: class I SAM-dependent methyltransferase [Candidatus Theseobacter exili]|nr:class I SAM-dependent methyltransferase [Candidatus Theseobacter exili]